METGSLLASPGGGCLGGGQVSRHSLSSVWSSKAEPEERLERPSRPQADGSQERRSAEEGTPADLTILGRPTVLVAEGPRE